MRFVLLLVALAACGDDSGVTVDAAHVDAPRIDSAPVDTVAIDAFLPDGSPPDGPTFPVSGTAYEIVAQNYATHAGIALAAYNAADDSLLSATATSAADGTFTLDLPMSAVGDAIYIKGVTPPNMYTYQDVYLYLPGPVQAVGGEILFFVISDHTFSIINGLLAVTQAPTNAWMYLFTYDASGEGANGVTVSTTPAAPRVYYNVNGAPSAAAVFTSPDGIAYIPNLAPGDLSITGSPGSFPSQALKARAGAITMTFLAE